MTDKGEEVDGFSGLNLKQVCQLLKLWIQVMQQHCLHLHRYRGSTAASLLIGLTYVGKCFKFKWKKGIWLL